MPRTVSFFRSVALVVVLGHLGAPWVVAQLPGDINPELFAALEYRHIGPVGNRVSAVTGVPGNLNIYYIGAASGGIFMLLE